MSSVRHKWKLANSTLAILMATFILISTSTPVALASSNKTLDQKLKDGVDEISRLSPVAITLLIGPIVGAFLLIIICYCICCKIRRINRRGNSDFVGITVLKAPPGQPGPIPLTGMVNQPRGGFPKLAAVPPTTKNGNCESTCLV